MQTKWFLGVLLYGLLLPASSIPAQAGALGGKTMTRRYDNSGWCHMPYREYGDEPSDTITYPVFFTADSTEATIRFEFDNFDKAGNWTNNIIDNVAVVKKAIFEGKELWDIGGCITGSYFDFTLLPDNDPRLVFKDLFIDGADPSWTGVGTPGTGSGQGASQQVFWVDTASSYEQAPKPEIALATGQVKNGALGVGRSTDPQKVTTQMIVHGLVPGEEYALSFWWRMSISSQAADLEGLGTTVTVSTPALRDDVPQTGMVGDETHYSWDEYYLDLPAGSSNLVIDLYGLTADADLYVRHEDSVDECVPFLGYTNPEHCVWSNPAPGRWLIQVTNYVPGPIGYTLRVRWDGSPGFFTVPPCRVLDTRNESGPLPAALDRHLRRYLQVPARCGIPFSARSVSANVTVVQPTAPGHLRLWPADTDIPGTSVINFSTGQVRANNAILPLAAAPADPADVDRSGQILIEPFLAGGGTVHVVIDVNGFFQDTDPPTAGGPP